MEISIVFTAQVVEVDGYAEVRETLNTPFYGDRARERAESFMRGEMVRGDFPESDGWWWFVESNQEANVRYGDDFAARLAGESV